MKEKFRWRRLARLFDMSVDDLSNLSRHKA